ncbi:hypothetical protein [Paraburkholderia sp. PGU19]|uniref:hypothetical protein n=1 Tax=Paraburkholderia sp. PGU19 TaxID=2735434 RepID=UPI0015DB04E4|nr:hypothetical protein [Paraburkholderia sp. PGU19]
MKRVMRSARALATNVGHVIAVWSVGTFGALRQSQELVVLAAFFCLLFFAAAKKSRCRPAQGRSVKQASESRMPAQTRANQNQPGHPRREGSTSDACAKSKKPNRLRSNHLKCERTNKPRTPTRTLSYRQPKAPQAKTKPEPEPEPKLKWKSTYP